MTQFFGMNEGALSTYSVTVESGGTSLISHWKLDGNGIDAGSVSNLTLSATTGGPPLLNDGGTSVHLNGTSQFARATNDGVYQNAAATIVFYAQPGSFPTSLQRTFVGKGANIAGEVQIEQRRATDINSSRMRAYIYDGALVNYADNGVNTPSDGCVETPADVAFMGALSVGPDGLQLYHWPAGGSIALVGSHPTTFGITPNTGDWFIGRSPYGDAGFFHGRFDNVQIYKGQLTLEQLALLPPPVTATIDPEPPPPPPPPPGQGNTLSAPSLAEWLKSDVATPAATKWVSNQNRGNGSGSSASNAQELQAALNGASPGQTFIAACQTPGTIEFWGYNNGLSFPSGTSGNLITLQARQGDGVVITAGNEWNGARTPHSGFWTQSGLSQSDIDKKIWRSTNVVGGAENMMGFWIEFDTPHQIVRASSMTNLRAAYGTADSPTNYSSPMVHKDTDGRVYIRFQRPHPSKYSTDNKWSVQTFPGYPEAVSGGKLVYPISENPNNYEIYVFRAGNQIAFNPGVSGHHIKIGAGINSMGYRHAFRGANAIRGDRGLHLTWFLFVEGSSTGNTKDDYFFNRTRCSSGCKLHASRSEWKFGGWLEPIRDACFAMVNSDTLSNFYWKDCTIGHYHELFVGSNRVNRVRFRNCTFVSILDDGFQTHQNINRWEYGYCYFYNSAYGGCGTSGAEGDATTPGQIFMHHNIVDLRQERGTNWRAQPHPHFLYAPHSPDGRSPWKTYNNLIIFGPDAEEEFGPFLMHCPNNTDNTLTGAANMHEVFNNILLRVFLEGTKRYDATSSLGGKYSDIFTNRSDFVQGGQSGSLTRYSAAFSNELFDYNVYWRSPGLNTDPLIKALVRGRGQAQTSYTSLANWRASGEFAHSKLSGAYRGAYSPGFDGNSTDSKPTMPTIDNYPLDRFNYRPSPTSVVTVASTGSLSGANWWNTPPSWGATYFPWNDGERTLAPTPWKGALNPNGTTLPVGVLNP